MNKLKWTIGLWALVIWVYPCYSQEERLSIGDPAPSLNAYEWLKGAPITSFQKGKAHVVEFGATWCKPCAAVIPELTALTKKYEGQLTVVGVFVQEINYEPAGTKEYAYINRVKKYVARMGEKMAYHVAVDGPEKTMEKTWIDAMGKGRGVPQTFVIDKEGRIAGHFSGSNIAKAEELIVSILAGTYNRNAAITTSAEQASSEIKYDRHKPLFINENGGNGSHAAYRSILAKYTGDFKGRHSSKIDSYYWVDYMEAKWPNLDWSKRRGMQGRFQTVNTSLEKLYTLAYSDTLFIEPYGRIQSTAAYPDTVAEPFMKRAYGKYWPTPILAVSDTTPFTWNSASTENSWNYVLEVPKEKATAYYLQQLMREDLHRYFGYLVNVETRRMPCTFIKARPGAAEELKTKTPGEKYAYPNFALSNGKTVLVRNAEMRDIIKLLYNAFNYEFDAQGKLIRKRFPVFVNATGLTGEMDYEMTPAEFQAFQNSNQEVIQSFLNRHGLYLEAGTKPMKVVVIRDPQPYTP